MMLRNRFFMYVCMLLCLLLQPMQSHAAAQIAFYGMDDVTPWNGTNGELKDTTAYWNGYYSPGGPWNGKAVGSPLPTLGFTDPAKTSYPWSTCGYSQHAGPTNNGGAFQISKLPLHTESGRQHSILFWMYWDGTDGVAPIGWNNYKLVIKNNRFGFDANDGRIYGVSATGLAKGWHHIAAVFTNNKVDDNSLYIDAKLQSLTFSGTQNLNAIASFDPDKSAVGTAVTPPTGWFTDNPSGRLEVNAANAYSVTGASTSNLVEVENLTGDYNLYTLITPDKGEELTLSVDNAARSNALTGTDSAIDVYVDNVFISRMNTQSTAIKHFDISLGFATGSAMRVEFRSVDANTNGGVMTNIKILENQAVATPNAFSIGGFGTSTSMRFSGRLDEVVVYIGAVNQNEVTGDMNYVHWCGRVGYLQIEHPGEGINCMPAEVKIKSCISTDANGQCVPASGDVGGYLNAVENGKVTSSQPFYIWWNSSSTSVSLTIPASKNVTFTVSDLSRTPENTSPFLCANKLYNNTSCAYVSHAAGFVVSDTLNGAPVSMANQLAGKESAKYYLRAVKTNTQTGACQAALAGANNVDFGYTCTNPTTCSTGNLMRMTGSSSVFIAANDKASSASQYTSVPMTFDSDGNAPFSVNFSDVGQTTLDIRKTVNTVQLTGSNAFTTKPDHLEISDIKSAADVANPAAQNASGTKFVVAGKPFKLSVAAYAADNKVTPNFGRETSPENVTIQPSLVAPAGGSAGQLSNNTTKNGDFTKGLAEMSSVSWNEVGIINLIPQLADNDYLGAGNVTAVTSANVGRFYPDRFSVSALTSAAACGGQFTYFGQDGWQTIFQINALDANGNITQNYSGDYGVNSFAKFDIKSYTKHSFSLSPVGFSLDANTKAPTGSWAKGVAKVTASHTVARPSAATAVTKLTVLAKPVDDDSVTVGSAAEISKASEFRYGKLFLPPTHGSELLPLPLQIESQYWTGTAYIRNRLDSCTTIPLSSIVMKNFRGNLTACETQLSGTANLSNGISNIKLSAPGIGSDGRPNSGSVDVEINTGNVASGEQTCSSTTVTSATNGALPWFGNADPAARATFGVYKSPVIYMRESF